MASTRKILSLCGNAVFRSIRLQALLKMHNCCTMAGFLTNCETWIIDKNERNKLERIELWALKRILDVPKTTPTAAIWHVTGMLMTSILIDKRQLLYLKKILNKPDENWIKQMFCCLAKDNIGWAKQILKTLAEYEITESIDEIKEVSNAAWRAKVTTVTEKKHKEKLVDLCLARGGVKTKTRYLLEKLKSDAYTRNPDMQILKKSRHLCRVQIMSMYGMLCCGKNFKGGQGGEYCKQCNAVDDENHRINYCPKYKNRNLHGSSLKFDFNVIHVGEGETVDRALEVVCELWDLRNGRNSMRK